MLRSPLLWATFSLLLALGAAATWLAVDPPPVAHHSASVLDEKTALERATAGYNAYLETKSLIMQEGGADPSRIDAVATHSLAAQTFEVADNVRDGDYHYAGGWTISEPELANRMIDEYGRAHVILRACLDESTIALISNSDGSDITDKDWKDRRHMIEVTLVTMSENSDRLTPYSSDSLHSEECAPLP